MTKTTTKTHTKTNTRTKTKTEESLPVYISLGTLYSNRYIYIGEQCQGTTFEKDKDKDVDKDKDKDK